MGLMKETTSAAIDTTAIHPGDLIRAKYADWNEAKNGIVTAVTGGGRSAAFIFRVFGTCAITF